MTKITTTLLILFISVACASPPEPTSTPTPLPEPQVISLDETAVVQSFTYMNPRSDDRITSFPEDDPNTIPFGREPVEAYAVWRDDTLTLIWGGFICSTSPVVTIAHQTITLWPNDAIWEDCESMEVAHGMEIGLDSDLPPEAWTFIFHPGDPPQNFASFTPEPTPLSPRTDAPFVQSVSTDIIILSWEYFDPSSKTQITFPPAERDAIHLNQQLFYESYIVWHDDGFDLLWREDACLEQPSLTISSDDDSAHLLLSATRPSTCDGQSRTHLFQVTLDSDISYRDWTYSSSEVRN